MSETIETIDQKIRKNARERIADGTIDNPQKLSVAVGRMLEDLELIGDLYAVEQRVPQFDGGE